MFKFLYYDLQSIFFKIESVFLSLTLLLVGFIYADKPIEIDYTVKINSTEISAGDNIEIPVDGYINVYCYCENTGKPFEGTDLHDNAHVSIYKYENGEKTYLSVSYIGVDAKPNPILIKSGEKFTEDSWSVLDPDAQPGTYTMEVTVFGHTQIYENVITVV